MRKAKKTKELVDWQNGIISKLDKIVPSYIDNRNPMYLAIDGFLYV